MLKQKKINHFIVPMFIIAPVKGFRLVRKTQECTTVYFTRKRQRKSTKNLKKTCYWKLIFVIWVIAREHVGAQSTQGTLAREHVSTQGTLALGHIRTQDTLACEHVSTQGTLAREHVRIVVVARHRMQLSFDFLIF